MLVQHLDESLVLSVPATIRNFSSIDQRRRRSSLVMISIVPSLTELKLRLMHSFKVKSLRHPTFAPEGVAARTLTDHRRVRASKSLCDSEPNDVAPAMISGSLNNRAGLTSRTCG